MKYILFILLMFSVSVARAESTGTIKGSTDTVIISTKTWQKTLDEVQAEIEYIQNNKQEIAQAKIDELQEALKKYEDPHREASPGNVTMREHLADMIDKEQTQWPEYTPGIMLKRLREREAELIK